MRRRFSITRQWDIDTGNASSTAEYVMEMEGEDPLVSERRLVVLAVQALGVAFFALATGWSAAVRIQLPFTPVPITLQTLPVLISGAVMGQGLGGASMLIYVLLGCAGMPFFSGMRSGLSVVFGPTGGYIAGFIAAAWLAGRIAHRQRPSWGRIALGVGAGSVVIYLFGVLGLSAVGLHPADVLSKGVLPFIPGDILKGVSAIVLLRISGRWTSRFFRPKRR